VVPPGLIETIDESRTVLGATDAHVEVLSEDTFCIWTGTNQYTVSTPSAEARLLRNVVTDILPRLTKAAPLGQVLSDPELDLARPILGQLSDMKLVFLPTDSVAAALHTDDDVRLYTYLARRSSEADRLFSLLKAQPIAISGRPPELVAEWCAVLRRQGLNLTGTPEAGGQPAGAAVTVWVSVGKQDPELLAVNARFHDAGQRWVAATFDRTEIRLGPWIDGEETACYACLPAIENVAANGAGGSGRSRPGPESATSWTTLQPGAVQWAGGVLAQLMLRALLPIGSAEPSWGRITVIDTGRMEQYSRRVWKDPYCPVCSRRGPMVQEWVEL
jgi:bacteriocin biosynthesis cyclodehydratase domain-containing protein